MIDLAKVWEVLAGEDHPGDCWFIETLEEALLEIRANREEIQAYKDKYISR
jgi:hypothetical protein